MIPFHNLEKLYMITGMILTNSTEKWSFSPNSVASIYAALQQNLKSDPTNESLFYQEIRKIKVQL